MIVRRLHSLHSHHIASKQGRFLCKGSSIPLLISTFKGLLPQSRSCAHHILGALQSPKCEIELHAARQSALDHDIHAAFQHFSQAVSLAADDAGMPSKRTSRRVVGSPNKPFFDSECRESKGRVRAAQDPAAKKLLEREYHALVRSKRRAFRLGRLRALLDQQYTQPRYFWKLLRSAQTPIPVSLQPVQMWDDYLDKLANMGQMRDCVLPHAAYPQQPLQHAACLKVAISEEEVQEALIGLHNGRAKGVQGLPSELLRYAKLEPDPEKPPPVNVLAPVLAVVLNAACQVGLIPSVVNDGQNTPNFQEG